MAPQNRHRSNEETSTGLTGYFTNPKRMEAVRTYRGPVVGILVACSAAFGFWLMATYLPREDAKKIYVTKEKFDSEVAHIKEQIKDVGEGVEKTNDLLIDLIREGNN